jgi:hypothetical protein
MTTSTARNHREQALGTELTQAVDRASKEVDPGRELFPRRVSSVNGRFVGVGFAI